MTRQQAENNIVRGTIHGLAAALGGCQSLHINSADEGRTIPVELTAKLALRTQEIVLHETGVADVADPLGGSYYVEWLTNRMEQEAESVIDQIDALGGWCAAVSRGWVREQVTQAAYKLQREIEGKERIVVGVNEYIEEEQDIFPAWEYDLEAVQRQLERLTDVRARRDPEQVRRAAEGLRQACQSGQNAIPATVTAVKAYMTVGEINKVYRDTGYSRIQM